MALSAPFDRVEAVTFTVAAGTAIATPQSQDISFTPAIVVGVEIFVPSGHNGNTGLQLDEAHTQIIPNTAGDWIIANNERIEWPLQNLSNTGNWQAVGYNTGRYPHTFYIRFLLIEIARGQEQGLLPAPVAL